VGYALIATVLALAALELVAVFIERVAPYSQQVLPHMDWEARSLHEELCGEDGAQVRCADLDANYAETTDRILARCEGDGEDAEYRPLEPPDKEDGEFRVLVLGGSSVFHYNHRRHDLLHPTTLTVAVDDSTGAFPVADSTVAPRDTESFWLVDAEVVVVGAVTDGVWTVTRGDEHGGPPSPHAEGAQVLPFFPHGMASDPGENEDIGEMSCRLGMIGQLEARLSALFGSSRKVTVVNGSYPGIGSSELVGVLHHMPESIAPDLVVIYSGVNEFMDWTYPVLEGDSPYVPFREVARRSHLYRLLFLGLRLAADAVIPRDREETYRPWSVFEDRAHLCLDHAVEDRTLFEPRDWRPVREAVRDRFDRNLRFLVAEARNLGAGVVLSTVVSNPRLPPCFGARQPLTVELVNSAAVREQRSRLLSGEAALASGRFDEALGSFEAAVRADSGAPLPESGKARALEGLGRHEEALEAFWQAREKAVGDFSSPLLVNEVIASVARAEGVPLLSALDSFQSWQNEHSTRRYLEELIYDECHPNPQGSALIVEGIVELARQEGLLPVDGGAPAGVGLPSESP